MGTLMRPRARHSQRGALMIEVLVTIVILAIGLAGLMQMQNRLQKSEMESYQRTQALILVNDMASRINTNRAIVDSYVTDTLGPAYLGVGGNSGACSWDYDDGLHQGDSGEWCRALRGAAETESGTTVGAMVGGPISFHSGGYAATPIAEILPVELPPAGAPESETLVTDRFSPRLTPGVERHPLLALARDPAQNAAAWAGLARLQGANVVSRVRPDAMVLLEHPEHRMEAGGSLPVLVVGEAGRGRVLALTTDTTWRWGITTGGDTGDASAGEDASKTEV